MMKSLLVTTTAFVLILSTANAAEAASNKELEQRIKELEMKLEAMDDLKKNIADLKIQLKKNGKVAKSYSSSGASTKEVASDFGKGFVPIPGTSSAIKFGGYVKLDASYDIGTAYGNDFVTFGTIPLDDSTDDRQDGEFNMTARQTRLNLTTLTKTGMGDLKVFLEGDFYESSGSTSTTNRHGFGVRHAYGELGNWLVGQNWSNFMDLSVYPGTLEFIGSAGTTHIRQPQIRYTNKFDHHNSFTIALESPSGDIRDTTGDTAVTDQFPDVTASYTYKDDFGHVSIRGMGRQINVYDTVTDNEEEEIGWGVALSAKVNLGSKNELFGRYAYGDGIGRYLFDAIAGSTGGAGYATDMLETQTAYGGYANLRHHWTDTLQTNLVGGHVSIDNETNIVGTAVNKSIWSAHINLIWKPVDKVKLGVEYMHGERELENGVEGDLDRILASAIYSF